MFIAKFQLQTETPVIGPEKFKYEFFFFFKSQLITVMNILIKLKLNFGDSPPNQGGRNKETKKQSYDRYNNIFLHPIFSRMGLHYFPIRYIEP